jgi:hypothetical protein
MHYLSTLFGTEFYMFRTDLLSIIRSPNTVFTAVGICHRMDRILTSLADGNITSMTNTYCCEYSIKIPDDGQ